MFEGTKGLHVIRYSNDRWLTRDGTGYYILVIIDHYFLTLSSYDLVYYLTSA